MAPRHPDVEVQLSGEDGNIFRIVGRVRRALRRAGVEDADIERFSDDVNAAPNYDAALRVVMSWVDVS